MTKKITRITSLILVVVLTAAMLAGCSLFVLNNQRYRSDTAITVGDVEITVGDFIDFYNNTMYQYVQNGYDAQTVWNSLGNQLLMNYIIFDTIKKEVAASNWTGVEQNEPYDTVALKYEAAQYLLDADDVELLLKNVRKSLYDSLNSLVETELGNRYTFDDPTEEEERLINVLDDYNIYEGALTDADFEDDIQKVNDELALYKDCDYTSFESMVNTYVFEEEDEKVSPLLTRLNKRIKQEEGIEEDEEGYKQISAKEFVTAQKAALNSLTRSVKTNYFGWSLAEFLDYQLNSTIFTRLTQEYMVNKYKDIETNDVIARLQNKLDNIIAAKQEYYALYPSKFVDEVGSLNKDSFVYFVPQQYQNQYAYIKNLLVQFTDEQKEQLANFERFGKNSEVYINFRNQLATQLVATDYTSQKNDEGEYTTKLENIFTLDNGQVKFAENTVLSNAINNLPSNTNISLRNEEFDRLIDKYNEDPGMQGKAYDYVLRVNEPDKAGKADSWVKEFSAAGREAIKEGLGDVQIAVTDFGVHIVYFSGYVTADIFDFSDLKELYTTNTATYRFFRAFYDDVKADIYTERFQLIIDRYFDEGKIKVVNKNLKKLLKEYGFKIEWKLD